MGFALHQAQLGLKPLSAKPLKVLGAGVLEIADDHDGDTYRAVYCVRFNDIVYVLHAFQKKSKRGIATSKRDVGIVKRRLRDAQADYRQRGGQT